MPTGTVKWFNRERGCGFIQPDQAGVKEVFVHIGAVEQAGLQGLNEGQRIQYELVEQVRNGPPTAGNLKTI
jgi:CspA family cold shock protein